MKKLIIILKFILLAIINIITLNSCKENFNNKKNNFIKPKHKLNIEESLIKKNWKLINNPNFINYKIDNKWYIIIFKNNTKNWNIIIFINDNKNDKILDEISFNNSCKNIYLSDIRNYFKNGDIKAIYQWNKNNNLNIPPQIPKINKNNGEILYWK